MQARTEKAEGQRLYVSESIITALHKLIIDMFLVLKEESKDYQNQH